MEKSKHKHQVSVKCPLCGKQTPERSFQPEGFEDDIFVVNVVGLGRGRGFRNTDERSAFDYSDCDELLERVAHRSLAIVGFLLQRGLVSKDQVLSKIGVQDSLKSMIGEIADALEEDWEDWDIEYDEGRGRTTLGILQFAIRRLIDDFQSLSAAGDEKPS